MLAHFVQPISPFRKHPFYGNYTCRTYCVFASCQHRQHQLMRRNQLEKPAAKQLSSELDPTKFDSFSSCCGWRFAAVILLWSEDEWKKNMPNSVRYFLLSNISCVHMRNLRSNRRKQQIFFTSIRQKKKKLLHDYVALKGKYCVCLLVSLKHCDVLGGLGDRVDKFCARTSIAIFDLINTRLFEMNRHTLTAK